MLPPIGFGPALLGLAAALLISGAQLPENPADPLPLAGHEDYRDPAGRMEGGVLRITLEAKAAEWRPWGADGPGVYTHVFAADGQAPRVPGPLIRVAAGTPVEVTVRNALPDTLAVRGLRDAGQGEPTLATVLAAQVVVAPGAETAIRFTPSVPGTYSYGGDRLPIGPPGDVGLPGWTEADRALRGMLIVDPPGQVPDPDERFFLITHWGDEALPASFLPATRFFINGRSWPHTERLTYAQGDTVRWRVVNFTGRPHPMHLHGFYFSVDARGTLFDEEVFAPGDRRLVVTEALDPAETMRMSWVASEPGNWLFHCHFMRHMSWVQTAPIDGAPPAHALAHAPTHAQGGPHGALEGEALMGGLVLGVTVLPDPDHVPADEPVRRQLELFINERPEVFGDEPGYAFVLGDGAERPAPDSVHFPGSPIVLTRGEPTGIVVRNQARVPLGVHWHGLELESWADGVPGWSGAPGSVVPAIAPGGSLAVRMTPPRAGTFMYHVHSEPGHQLAQGLYAPFLVLEPGDAWDAERDRLFLLGSLGAGDDPPPAVNGRLEPEPESFRVGERYRLRFMHISPDDDKEVALLRNDAPVRWRQVAKDGADLPPHQVAEGPAELRIHVGETFDFLWAPTEPGEYTLRIVTDFDAGAPLFPRDAPPPDTLRIPMVVGDADAGVREMGAAAGAPIRPTRAGAAQPTPRSEPIPRFEPGPCPFEAEPEVLAQFRCGSLTVLEDRSRPDGRTLKLAVAVLSSTSDDPQPDPLVLVPGGPGDAYLHRFAAAVASEIRADREIVAFDPRGTGFSEPAVCSELDEEWQWIRWVVDLEPEERRREEIAALERCRREIERERIDLSQYNTRSDALDLDDLRRALGYDRWNVWGRSYGSLVALEGLRATPQGIRSVVLDGPTPPDVGRSIEERNRKFADALSRLFAGCADEPSCDAALPDAEARFWEAIEGLDREPMVIPTGGRAGLPDPVVLRGANLAAGARRALYSRSARLSMPLVAHEVLARNEGFVLEVVAQMVTSSWTPRAWKYLSVDCHDRHPFTGLPSPVPAHERGEAVLAGAGRAEYDPAICEAWHPFRADAAFAAPVVSATPALILTGEFDPAAHRAYGPHVAASLERAQLVEVPGGGHVEGNQSPCARAMIAEFLRDPGRSVDTDCLATLPPVRFATRVEEPSGDGTATRRQAGPTDPSPGSPGFGTGDASGVSAQVAPRTYHATIRRTPWGVAHIEAADLGSLGFGEGYAQAEDHVCTIAEQMMGARGERARFLGPGQGDANVLADLAVKGLAVRERALELLSEQPPEVRGWADGFAAGFNRYLADASPDAIPAWCRDAEWLLPMSGDDLATYVRMGSLAALPLAPAILQAAPPGASEAGSAGRADGEEQARDPLEVAWSWDEASAGAFASNGWALGRDRTASGRGMLVTNPHYPWTGPNRFWEKHLVIPGVLDVYGVNLIGVPGVGIGFNEGVAWTHTASQGSRRTLYALELDPEDPLRYRHGDTLHPLVAREVEVEVRGRDEPVRRTLWFSHHGPVVGAAPLQWTREQAFAVRDAGEDNLGMFLHMLATAQARSVEELRDAHARYQAIMHFHTVASDSGGRAWYVHSPATPNLSPRALEVWRERTERDPLAGQMARQGAMLLDGSDPLFDWVDAPEAARSGIVPVRELPQILRTDYVFNANDSYWVPHGEARIEGDHSPLHGSVRAPLSLRSRTSVLHLENRVPGLPVGDDGRFTLEALQAAIRSERSLAADLLLPELVERCRAAPPVQLDSGDPVALRAACEVLEGWDRRFTPESRGAVLFREWVSRYEVGDTERAGALFAHDFDPDDPVHTPRGLAPGDRAVEELARAVRILEDQGIALDTPLGALQFAGPRSPPRIPVPGGNGSLEGVLSRTQFSPRGTTLEPLDLPAPVPGSRFLTEAGYPVFDGTSFLMVLEFTDRGPRAEAVLTYGQSGNPDSPHFRDQTELYARDAWRPVFFRAEEVRANAVRTYQVDG